MPNLYPTNYQNKTITADAEASDTKIGYKPGVCYDLSKCCILRDGKNQVMSATGVESWMQWCFNCLNTEKYSCAAYPAFGIEKESAIKAQTREEAEAILTVQITDALMADPYKRTEYVKEIIFNWIEPDGLEVKVTVKGIDDAEIDLIISLK